MEFSILLERESSNNVATYGRLYVLDSKNVVVLSLVTLELPWLFNEPRISCIPRGKYVIKPHVSPSKGRCISLLNVPSRANILIHSGNYASDTLGCILVGTSYGHLDYGYDLDCVNSRVAMASLLPFFDKESVIRITNSLTNKEEYVK